MTSGMFKVFMYEHYHEELSNEAVAKIISDATTPFDLDSLLAHGCREPDKTDGDRMLSFVEFCSIVYSFKMTVEGRQAEAKLQVGLV